MINYSIIIPQKNCAELTRRCIHSIPKREDIQVIVIDDNSTNISELDSISKDLNRPTDLLICTKEGKGAGYARNIGMAKALGRWLVFADADDFFSPDAFLILDQFVDSKHDLIYFLHNSVYSDSLQPCFRYDYRNFLIKQYVKKTNIHTANELKYGDVSPWAKMFRRSLIDEKGQKFDEVPASNDVTFVSRMAYFSRDIRVCDKSVYYLTYRKGSITRVVNKTNELSRFKVCLKFNNFLKEIGCKHLENRIISRVWIAYKHFGFKEAVKYIKLARQSNQSIFTALIPRWNNIKNKAFLIWSRNSYQG